MKHLVKLNVAGLELTLACPCRCETCGSNAGKPRENELDTTEWLGVVNALADLGCKRLSLLGGEPLLRPDWAEIGKAATDRDMWVDMITSGMGLDEKCVEKVRDAGFVSITVSVDGTQQVHDTQRKVNGSYGQAMEAIRLLDRAGVRVGVTTQVNADTLPELEALAPELESAGAMGWQLQLTLPAGRAEGRHDLVLAPERMADLYATVGRLVKRRGLRPFITDNIGYLTSDDPVLRTPPSAPPRCWLGCFAGLRAIGITSSGDVKGCLALPDSCIEGNVREEPLERVWNDSNRFSYNRAFKLSNLGGPCAGCVYGDVCRGGCTAMAMAVHGKPSVSTHCFRLHGVK